ncbi:winged helix-turn-helix domain-containing protein [Aliikangiella sp. IMCC44359]|uniref:winged helix-turn-helix domain-containing protein n=1 Tax=Aliikangiella sp. IMCC44359 TaxID=3459125 RepID=UPI00403B06E4
MKYQVASFVIDTVQFDITQNNKTVSIEPKVFDLIVYLIEKRHRVVPREELFETIWEGRDVSDTTLSNSVKSARKLFGDSGERQQVVRTVRGRGYQFVAEVVDLSLNDSTNPDKSLMDKSGRNQSNKKSVVGKPPFNQSDMRTANRWSYGILGAIVVVFLVVTIFSFSSTDSMESPYILVTPFEVSGQDKEKWQPFADQMTREVILNLRKISGLRVVPSSSAFTFKKNKTHKYIKEQLPHIKYVLTANINIGRNSLLQVTSELDELSSGKLIWDDHYESRVDNTTFFSIQSKMARAVSQSLKVVILDDEKTTLGELPTNDLRAYEFYIAGQQQRDLLTHQSLKKAVTLFSKAISLDPQFEAAYVAKADAYRIIMVYFEKPSEVLPKVVEAVAETLKINPQSAEARASLGLAYVFAWRWEDAWDMLKQAKELDPNIALTELGFALYYCGLGLPDGVRQSLNTANQLDPLNIEIADWGHWALAMVGEIKEAVNWSSQKVRLHPDVGLIYSSASMAASLVGEHQRAISLAKRGVELDSGISYPLLALAQAYGHAGEVEKVPQILEQVESFNSYLCDYETAVTYLLIDNLGKTFEHLNKAVSYRSNCLIFTRNDPRLKSLRNDPRYLAILTRVGLDEQSVKNYSR